MIKGHHIPWLLLCFAVWFAGLTLWTIIAEADDGKHCYIHESGAPTICLLDAYQPVDAVTSNQAIVFTPTTDSVCAGWASGTQSYCYCSTCLLYTSPSPRDQRPNLVCRVMV